MLLFNPDIESICARDQYYISHSIGIKHGHDLPIKVLHVKYHKEATIKPKRKECSILAKHNKKRKAICKVVCGNFLTSWVVVDTRLGHHVSVQQCQS
jgi:hypothetical protein